MQWDHFVCPNCSQKRKHSAFELVLLSDFRVPPNKLVEVAFHLGKGGNFVGEKVNRGQNICSIDASVGYGKNFEKQAQSLSLCGLKVSTKSDIDLTCV